MGEFSSNSPGSRAESSGEPAAAAAGTTDPDGTSATVAVDGLAVGARLPAPALISLILNPSRSSSKLEKLMREIIALVLEKKVKPVIGQVVDFADVPAALEALANRQTVGRTIVMLA